MRNKNPREAIKTLCRGVTILHETNEQPEDITLAYLRIAENLAKPGKHKESIAACNLALETFIEEDMVNVIFRIAYKFRAEQYLKLKQKEKARADLEKLLEIDPESADGLELIKKL